MQQPLVDLWNAIQTYHALVPWLILLIVALVFLRNREISSRLKRLKVGPGGFEIELFEKLRELRKTAEDAADDVAKEVISEPVIIAVPTARASAEAHPPRVLVGGVPISEAIEPVDAGESVDGDDDEVPSILSEAAANPKAALIRLSVAIEDEVMRLLASAGFLGGRTYIPIPLAVEILRTRYRVLPESVLSALEAFQKVRNQIVHSGEALPDETLRAIDSGLIVLRTLQGLPKTKHVVYHPGVPVYADSEGKEERSGVKAVIVDQTSGGGLIKSKGVYPTTRDHFRKGMEVAWEWNGKAVWGESWYLDPDTETIEYGWTESAEFVGRDLDALGEESPSSSS